MLEVFSFANALALVVVIFYIVFWLLARFSAKWFKYLFDAQFFGADTSSLFKEGFKFNFGVLVSAAATIWITGYLFSWLYNYFL